MSTLECFVFSWAFASSYAVTVLYVRSLDPAVGWPFPAVLVDWWRSALYLASTTAVAMWWRHVAQKADGSSVGLLGGQAAAAALAALLALLLAGLSLKPLGLLRTPAAREND